MVTAARPSLKNQVDVSSVGETMALMRQVRSSDTEQRFQLGYGGAESNVLTQVAQLGLRTRWLSSLGEDSFGQAVRASLEERGVEVICVGPEGRQTGLMVKSYGTQPDPIVVYYRTNSAASQLVLAEAQIKEALAANVIHLTGIFPALSETARKTAKTLVDRAVEAQVPVSFDVNYRPRLWSRAAAAEALSTVWEKASFIFGDRDELSLLSGPSVPDDDRHLMEKLSGGARVVVLKRGSEGAAVLWGDTFLELPAFPADVLDTVGAGDAFVGGFLVGVCEGWGPEQCLMSATVCGARACEHLGDWEGQIDRPGLEKITRR